MTELEQLRKEINELRERVAVIEQRMSNHAGAPQTGHWGSMFYKPSTLPTYPPGVRSMDPQCGVQN